MQSESCRAIFFLRFNLDCVLGKIKEMVKEVTVFVHEEFNSQTYDSCKNVQYPEVGK